MPMYNLVIVIFSVVSVGGILLVFLAHLNQLGKFYVNDEKNVTFLGRWLKSPFNSTDGPEVCFSFILVASACVVSVMLSHFWPVYIVAMLCGVIYGALRCVRYFTRKRKQFKKVAELLHSHPGSVEHTIVGMRDVDF